MRRGLGAMRGAESIVRIDIAQRGHFLRELIAVLLFALVDTAILQQHHIARHYIDAVHPIAKQRHRAPEQFAHTPGDRSQRIF